MQSAFYLGYFLISLPAAIFMRRYGYKAGLVTGLLLFSLGTFLFWPAAIAGRYSFFLAALFVIAAGLSFLETGANPFVVQLGDPSTAERRLNLAQAFNPLGAIARALAGKLFISSGVELGQPEVDAMKAAGTYEAYLRGETMRVVQSYLVLAAITFAWALVILRTKFPSMPGEDSGTREKCTIGSLLGRRHFVLAVLAKFFYVGAQVGTWSYFIQYVQDYTAQPEKTAGFYLSGTLFAFGLGRFASTWMMRFVARNVLMGIYALANVALAGAAVLFPGWVGMWCLLTTSFFMSIMFPTIFALGLRGLGPSAKVGGSLIVMGIVGGAVFTPLMGLIAAQQMALAMLVPLGCYLFIAYFSFAGCHPAEPAAGA